VLSGDPPPHGKGHSSPQFSAIALARIPAGSHFTHNPFCRLGSARRAAVVAMLPELPPVYTVSQKITSHYNIVHNFAKCSNFHSFLLVADSLLNMQQNRH